MARNKKELTPKEIRVLELAMDVCEKIKRGTGDAAFHAEGASGHLESLRAFFGESEPLDDEPD